MFLSVKRGGPLQYSTDTCLDPVDSHVLFDVFLHHVRISAPSERSFLFWKLLFFSTWRPPSHPAVFAQINRNAKWLKFTCGFEPPHPSDHSGAQYLGIHSFEPIQSKFFFFPLAENECQGASFTHGRGVLVCSHTLHYSAAFPHCLISCLLFAAGNYFWKCRLLCGLHDKWPLFIQ